MELEIINKLYLELSQITTATTAREILLQKQLAEAQRDMEMLRGALEVLADYVDERIGDNECRPRENARAELADIKTGEANE